MLYHGTCYKAELLSALLSLYELKDKTPQLDKQIIVTTSYCGLKYVPSSPTSQKKHLKQTNAIVLIISKTKKTHW